MALPFMLPFPSVSFLKQYLHWHYVLNFLACFAYILTRAHRGVCQVFYTEKHPEDCELDYYDANVLMFLAFVLAVKNRKWKPIHANDFLSGMFLFTKATNVLLFFRKDARYGCLYLIFCLVMFLVFPEPSYHGPDEVHMFRGQGLDEELLHNPQTTWLVEFYTTWSPPCMRFSGVFANLSLRYNHELFKFGKLNCSAYETIAKKYRVDVSVKSKNLPTLILFENGKEKIRRPVVCLDGSVKRFDWKMENIIRDFDLNEHLAAAKRKSKDRNSKQVKKEK